MKYSVYNNRSFHEERKRFARKALEQISEVIRDRGGEISPEVLGNMRIQELLEILSTNDVHIIAVDTRDKETFERIRSTRKL